MITENHSWQKAGSLAQGIRLVSVGKFYSLGIIFNLLQLSKNFSFQQDFLSVQESEEDHPGLHVGFA